MREMNQLSGGQKSLVAMALIFAIQVGLSQKKCRESEELNLTLRHSPELFGLDS